MAMILARKNAITHWRNVIGPTQTAKARDEAPNRLVVKSPKNMLTNSLQKLSLSLDIQFSLR